MTLAKQKPTKHKAKEQANKQTKHQHKRPAASAEVFLKDGSLYDGPDDEAFLVSLRRSLKTARGAYPQVALAEIYQEYKSLTKIRRLHLMVVDLGRSRSVSSHVYQDFMNCHLHPDLAGSLNTLPVPISRKDCPFKTRRVADMQPTHACTIFETTNYRSGTKQPPHVKGSCKCHCCTGLLQAEQGPPSSGVLSYVCSDHRGWGL